MMGHRSLAVDQAKEFGSLVEYWAGFRVSSSHGKKGFCSLYARVLVSNSIFARPFLVARSGQMRSPSPQPD